MGFDYIAYYTIKDMLREQSYCDIVEKGWRRYCGNRVTYTSIIG